MKLYIKYMVSSRCKDLVKKELKILGLHFSTIYLGEASIQEDITTEQKQLLAKALAKSGLELMDDKEGILMEKIKGSIVGLIHYSDDMKKVNFSSYLSKRLGLDYTFISQKFSEIEGITIEQFIIRHKIERVKELILYDKLSLTEIAWNLQYSSVAALSNQFKKFTGLTPTQFKSIKLEH